MKKALLILLLMCGIAQAQEVVTAFDNKTLPVLNEELRRTRASTSANGLSILTLSAEIDVLQAQFSAFETIPQGAILMWSGTIATIPAGWELADGSCSITCPDLRDRFIVAATSDDAGVAKTNVTGALTQSGDGTIPIHTHQLIIDPTSGSGSAYPEFSVGMSDQAESSYTTTSFGTGTKNIAVYYALAFIIKT